MWEVLFFFKYILPLKLPRLCLQACTLLLSVLFIYDVFFVFITPFLTNVRGGGFAGQASALLCLARLTLTLVCVCVSPFQSGESIMVEVAAGPSDSATHEKVSLLTTTSTPPTPAPPHDWIHDLLLLPLPASYGAQSAQVKLLPPGSLRPSLLSPGLRRHFSPR